MSEKDINPKFCLFILNCLFHFSLIILGESNDNNNIFLSKYFNFNNLDGVYSGDNISGSYFFGIDTSTITSTNSINYIIMDMIFKQSYFNGLSLTNKRYVC